MKTPDQFVNDFRVALKGRDVVGAVNILNAETRDLQAESSLPTSKAFATAADLIKEPSKLEKAVIKLAGLSLGVPKRDLRDLAA